MPIAYPAILDARSDGGIRRWDTPETLLYALAIGLGSDPLDQHELPFVYEKDQRVVPTFAAVLARGLGVGVEQMGIDYRRAMHGEQAIVWHRPLAPQGEVTGEGRIVAVYDKGDKGAIIIGEIAFTDSQTADPVATVTVTTFARGDGHCGAPKDGAPAPHQMPERAPDLTLSIPTRRDLALLYRLTGDLNPLHVDPVAARAAGFDRPILHGLCTFGIASRAVMQGFTDYDPTRLRSLAVRFSAPALPGDALVFDLWRDGDIVSFEARVPARDVVVLKGGKAELRP